MTTTARDAALKYLLRREAERLRTEAPRDAARGSHAVIEKAVKPGRSGPGYKATCFLDSSIVYLTDVRCNPYPPLSDR